MFARKIIRCLAALFFYVTLSAGAGAFGLGELGGSFGMLGSPGGSACNGIPSSFPFGADFASGCSRGASYNSLVTTSRTTTNGTATAPDSAGNYVQFADAVPRITTGRGIWSEDGRTNSIRNPIMLGAVIADGIERVTNGNLALDPINAAQNTVQNGFQWTVAAGVAVPVWTPGSPGTVTLTPDGVNTLNFSTGALTTVNGVTYTVTVDVTGSAANLRIGTAPYNSDLVGVNTGTTIGQKFQFTATTTTSYVTFARQSAGSAVISNLSVQSAGRLPNNAAGWSDNTTGMGRRVVAIGTESGIDAMDLEVFAGTNAAGGYTDYQWDITPSAALYGQTWVQSGFQKVIAGTLPVGLVMLVYGSPSFSDNNSATIIPSGTTAQSTPLGLSRASVAKTFAVVSISGVSVRYALTPPAGAFSVTIRTGWPQLENNGLINSSVASATVNTGGTLYVGNGTMTWAGTGCTTNPVLNVTETAGIIDAVTSVAVAGSCTTFPPAGATTWTPGGGLSAGSGASFNLVPTNNAAQAFATTPILSNGSSVGVRGGDGNLWANPPAIGSAVSGFARVSAWNVPAVNSSNIGNLIDITSGVVTNRIQFASRNSASQPGISSNAGGVGNASIAIPTAIQQNATPSIAFSFAQGTNTQAVSLNGGTPVMANVTTFPSGLSTPVIGIGNRFASNSQNCNCAIAAIGLNPTSPASSATLIAATTVLPDIDLDFMAGQYRGVTGPPSSFLTTTRTATGGSATVWNSANVYSLVADNTPRVSDLGYLGEPQRTQSNINNSWQGATTGTPGSGPTGWSTPFAALAASGLMVQTVSIGSSNGVDVSRYRISGTSTSAGAASWIPNFATAAQNQTWTGAWFVAMPAGSTTGFSQIGIRTRTLTSAFVATADVTNPIIGSIGPTLTRYNQTVTAPADGANVTTQAAGYFQINWNDASTIDVTFDLGWPTLEQGDGPTSPVRTTNAAVTRAGDNTRLTVTPPFGPTYSMAVAWTPQSPIASATNQNALQLDEPVGGDGQRSVLRRQQTTGRVLFAGVGGTGWNTSPATVFNPNVLTKWSARIAPGDIRPSFDGVLGTTALGAVLPTTPTIIRLGANFGGIENANGFIQRVQIWQNTGIPDNQLQVSPP